MSPVGLWEWAVDPRAGRAISGVSGERHRAMTALSRTLITIGTASGSVVPIGLVEGAYGFSYVRLSPVLTADCERGVIKWHGNRQLSGREGSLPEARSPGQK